METKNAPGTAAGGGHVRAPNTISRPTLRHFLLYSSLLVVLPYLIMHHFPTLSTLAGLLISGLAKTGAQSGDLDAWISAESTIAFQGIINNIGADGAKAVGAKSGIVVASPSMSDPNYFYTWTRDAGLTYKCLIDELIAGRAEVESSIQDYVVAQAVLQTVSNPSGDLCTGGLAEPKFNVDESAFTGSWGRPQRDGPAIRAIALTAYANVLLSRGNSTLVADIIWPVVQNDLSYVAQYWNSSTFDLWEEVDSSSFFTTAVQYRALVEGGTLAKALGKTCSFCDSQSPLVLCFLQTYWTGKYALSNTGGGRSGQDINSVLTSIHLFDQDAGCNDMTFQPCSARALANHRIVTDSFRPIYAINDGIGAGSAVALGRYAEDVYQGGHPWYLSNFAAAEQLYYAVAQWQKQGLIQVTSTSMPFFVPLLQSIEPGTFTNDTSKFSEIMESVQTYADGYMAIAQKYTPSDGSLAEQFSRSDGTALSAKDLTWSYAAFLTAANARVGRLPPSWHASAVTPPSICVPGSAVGPCATPTNTIWPGRPSSTSAPCPTSTITSVAFSVLKKTFLGESVLLSGNTTELGGWDIGKAVVLDTAQYSDADPIWSGSINLTTASTVEYKYVLRTTQGENVWESNPNRVFDVADGCNRTVARADLWR